MSTTSVFATLSTIDCRGRIETKPTGNGKSISYLSWAWAWQILKEKYPSAYYTVYENKDGLNYHTDGRTCWVKTGVTVEGIEHIEYLPVMDYRNASIPVSKVTSYDVNKSIQRSLTKAVARHGLGLYIYAGEDIPDPYDDEQRAMVTNYVSPNEQAAPTSLSAPKADKPIMHQGHENWSAILKTIASGQYTLEQYKKKYYFPEADEIAAKEWILKNQQL